MDDKDSLLKAIRDGSLAEIKKAVKARKKKNKGAVKLLADSFDYVKAAIMRGDSDISNFVIDSGAALVGERIVNLDNSSASALKNLISGAGSARGPAHKVDRHQTALHIAASEGRVDILQKLILLNEINPALKDQEGFTALGLVEKSACSKEAKEVMVKFLVAAQEIYNGLDDFAKEAAKNAVVQTAISPNLLRRESENFLPKSDGQGRSGKPKRAPEEEKRYSEAVAEFEKKIAEIKERQVKQQEEITEFLNRAAGLAGLEKHTKTSIENFLNKGYPLNVTTNYSKGGKDSVDGQNSAMHLAAQNGDFATVKLLFEHGASANLINSQGGSALDEAKFLDESKYPNKKDLIEFLTPPTTVKSPSATRVLSLLQNTK